ncbi:hypothetical protein [Nitrosarchaeum koreense]|uniref:DUF2357 domain-containing protein n=1 Tax=Nitrosarchaeum koreense MY1 TaxID=1001994 RepID=F9CXT7_9ARCH|nr:hypothetical protein [Nitrosarchaeum koreense]EGP94053.1 hypothetical protein MY1_1295 [Nitrosarchaeum koreense MY1]
MNRQELADEIIRIKNEQNIDPKTLIRPEFTLLPNFQYLYVEFEKVKLEGEKWHQFVRFVLTPKEEWRYMYERLAYLLKIHRGGFEDYFVLKSGTQSNSMPDRMTDFIRFHKLYEEFYQIYSKIIRRIQVDYPTVDYVGQMIRGKIDWKKTILKSNGQFPLSFEMSTWSRKFATSENILLFLSTNWLNKEATTLINTKFSEPLHMDEIQTLYDVESNTNRLIQNFPYYEIIQASKRFSKLLPNDKEIIQLMNDVEFRVKQGTIRNKGYLELLDWIKKLNELSLEFLSGNPTRFHIDSLSDLDTIYEAWIFLEFIEFCNVKKHLDVNLILGKSTDDLTFFEFRFDGHDIVMYYDRKFYKTKGETWTLDHQPDFSVFIDGKLVALFDAKNYSKSSEKADGINKMLAYLINLDANYGALIFPKIENKEPFELKNGKYHKEQILTHYQMNPVDSAIDIQTKIDSMETIFSKIIGGIEQKIPN